MGSLSFPKEYHLLRSSEFRPVYGEGIKRHSRAFVLFRLPNAFDHPRLGLSVGRKFGKAVRRNRIRRLIREAVRLHWRRWRLGGSDLVVIPKRGAETYGIEEVTSEFSKSFFAAKRGA